MAEFVWFFGASGAGKASAMKKVHKGELVIPRIGERTFVSKESLDFSREQRVLFLGEDLGKYILRDLTVLIKGQSTDLSTTRIPYNLHSDFPDTKQEVVFIYTDPALLYERTEARQDGYWPNPKHDFVSETAFQIDEVSKLCENLEVEPILIDNSGAEPQILLNAQLSDL